jgi:recombination protein RecA
MEQNEKIINFKKEILKQYGKNSILSANEENSVGDIIPVSSLTLKNALGIGGFSKNKIYEILGWESSGKSTLCYDAIANAQKTYGDHCLLIDKENSFDKFYAQ